MKAIVIHIVIVLLFQLVIIDYSKAGDSTDCINGPYTIIFDCIPTIQGKELQDGDIISIFSEADVVNQQGSLVYHSNSDSTNSISISADSADVAMPNTSNISFSVNSQSNACISTDVKYTSDTVNSQECTLRITSFSARFHYLYFTDTVICSTSDPIFPETNIPEGSISYNVFPDGLKIGSSGEILSSGSPPGKYQVFMETDYCLSQDTFEIEIIASPSGNLIANERICRGMSIADIKFEFPQYNFISDTEIDSYYEEISESGTYPVLTDQYPCPVVDSIYVELIENPVFDIDISRACDHVLVDVNSQERNFTVVYSDNTGEISNKIVEDTELFIEVTNEDGCRTIDSIRVDVNIMQFTSATFDKEDADCWDEGKIIIREDFVTNNVGNYSYRLRNTLTNGVVDRLDNVPEGIYNLQVVDERDCAAENENSIVVLQDCLENYPVFTPDGDNIEDSYFIPHEGSVKIYDREGQLLRELETPEYWDGKDDSGNVLPMGNYLLITDTGKPVNITIIR